MPRTTTTKAKTQAPQCGTEVTMEEASRLWELARFVRQYLADIQRSPFYEPRESWSDYSLPVAGWFPSSFLTGRAWKKPPARSQPARGLLDPDFHPYSESQRQIVEIRHATAVAETFRADLARNEIYKNWTERHPKLLDVVAAFDRLARSPKEHELRKPHAFARFLLTIISSVTVVATPGRIAPTKAAIRRAANIAKELSGMSKDGMYGIEEFFPAQLKLFELIAALEKADKQPALTTIDGRTRKRAPKSGSDARKRAALDAFQRELGKAFGAPETRLRPIFLSFAALIVYSNPSDAVSP